MMTWLKRAPVAIAGLLWLSGFFIRDGGVGVVNGVVVFLIVWWLFFFTMLPIGVQSQEESGDVVEGSERGAPQAPNLPRKMWWSTVAASTVWIIYFIVNESGVLAPFMPSGAY